MEANRIEMTSYKPGLLLVWVYLIPLTLASLGAGWTLIEGHDLSLGMIILMAVVFLNGQVAWSVFRR